MGQNRAVFEALDDDKTWVIEGWPKLQVEQQAKLDNKLDMLRTAEVDPVTRKVGLPLTLLGGPGIYGNKWIYELKIKGRVALRPMLCLGPIDDDSEWTVLVRAVEKDDTLRPPNAADIADTRRTEVLKRLRLRKERAKAS